MRRASSQRCARSALTTFRNALARARALKEALRENYVGVCLRSARLARAGNFSPMAAKHELFHVIRDHLAERREAHARLSGFLCRHAFRGEIQRLHDDVADDDFEDAVRAGW